MSGIEVVGLVLGGIPVLISGLKLFANGFQTMKSLWEYETVVERLINRFTLAEGIFRHCVEVLLMPELEVWQDPGLLEGRSPNWRNQELQESVRRRLGSDYEGFIRAVQTLNKDINRFLRKLRIREETNQVRADSLLPCLV